MFKNQSFVKNQIFGETKIGPKVLLNNPHLNYAHKGGIQMAGIPMTETEIEALLDVLDRDNDGEINYRYYFLAKFRT